MVLRPAGRLLAGLLAVLLAALAGWGVRDASLRGDVVRVGIPGVPEAYGWAGAVPYERDVIRVPSLAGTVPGDREPWGLYLPEDGRILLREDDGTVFWGSNAPSAQEVYLHELGHACLDDWLREERGAVLGVATGREIDGGPGLLAAAFGPRVLQEAIGEYENLRISGEADSWYGTTEVGSFGEWFAESFRGYLLDEPVPPAMGRLLGSIEGSRVP